MCESNVPDLNPIPPAIKICDVDESEIASKLKRPSKMKPKNSRAANYKALAATSRQHKTQSARTAEPFDARMSKFVRHTMENHCLRAAEDEYTKMKECTFVPATNRSTRNLMGNSTQRSTTEFYQDQMAYVCKTNERLKQSKVSLEQSVVAENQPPQICPRSQAMFQKMKQRLSDSSSVSISSSAFDRLYSHSKSRTQTTSNVTGVLSIYRPKTPAAGLTFNFNPAIQKRSQDLRREDSIGQLLFSDAAAREEKTAQKRRESSHDLTLSGNTPYTLRQSDAYLSGKFAEQFEAVWLQTTGTKSSSLPTKEVLGISPSGSNPE